MTRPFCKRRQRVISALLWKTACSARTAKPDRRVLCCASVSRRWMQRSGWSVQRSGATIALNAKRRTRPLCHPPSAGRLLMVLRKQSAIDRPCSVRAHNKKNVPRTRPARPHKPRGVPMGLHGHARTKKQNARQRSSAGLVCCSHRQTALLQGIKHQSRCQLSLDVSSTCAGMFREQDWLGAPHSWLLTTPLS